MDFFRFLTWTCALLLTTFCAQMDAKEDLVTTTVTQTQLLKGTQNRPDGVKFWHEKLSNEDIRKLYGADAIEKLSIQGAMKLQTSGIKPKDRYTLYQVNSLLNKTKVAEYVADQQGQLKNVKRGGPALSGITLLLADLMNGESVYFALESADKKRCIVTQVTFDPIEYTWADGAYVYASLSSADATQFTIAGKGFRPNEKLMVTSTSGNEVIPFDAEATNAGAFFSIAMPGVKGKTGGAASFSIERKATKETGTLNYLWGTSAKAKSKKSLVDIQSKNSKNLMSGVAG